MSVYLNKESEYYYSFSETPTQYTISKDYTESDFNIGCFYVPQLNKIFAINEKHLKNFKPNKNLFDPIIAKSLESRMYPGFTIFDNLMKFVPIVKKIRDRYFVEHFMNIVANFYAVYMYDTVRPYEYKNGYWEFRNYNIIALSMWTKEGFERFKAAKKKLSKKETCLLDLGTLYAYYVVNRKSEGIRCGHNFKSIIPATVMFAKLLKLPGTERDNYFPRFDLWIYNWNEYVGTVESDIPLDDNIGKWAVPKHPDIKFGYFTCITPTSNCGDHNTCSYSNKKDWIKKYCNETMKQNLTDSEAAKIIFDDEPEYKIVERYSFPLHCRDSFDG